MTSSKSRRWKKGRGKLGALEPLLGSWVAEAETPMGPVRCTRTFSRILAGFYLALDARWEMPGGKVYDERAVYGAGGDGGIVFWSFTSDGKRSTGALADGTDVDPEAICFEAQMPAGLARMIYWPSDEDGINWAVESRTKKGWNRFTMHRYRPR